MAKRRLAITKRIDLSDIAEGWTTDCYAIVLEATRREYLSFAELDTKSMTERKAITIQSKFVQEHLVSGQVMVLDDSNQFAITPLTHGDIEDNAEIATRLFLAIIGGDADPKGTKTPTDASPSEPATSEPASAADTTATMSSTN